ncbi:MAG: hypothetical protein HC780_13955 [Leptolyngbyaceae cyanobacterium CSU_1_3]|nr:hypothetical protein [Leptolyngbyaceae cyanobacterium CSU_1_3]
MGTYTVDEPVYSWNETSKNPPSIRFTINQQVFIYTLSGYKIKDFGRGVGVEPLAGGAAPHPF